MNEIMLLIDQAFEHEPAFVVGDLAAFKRLRDGIDRLIRREKTVQLEMMQADGEGYSLYLVVEPDPTDVPVHYACNAMAAGMLHRSGEEKKLHQYLKEALRQIKG